MSDRESEPVALFDLDGTLADFDSAMLAHMNALATPGEEAFCYDQDREPPHLKARRRLVKRQPGFWLGLAPLKPGFEVLRMCIELDYRINILSKAPNEHSGFAAWAEKAQWCHRHLPSVCSDFSISLVQDKGLHYGRVLVDDWPSYIVRWLEWRPRGLVIMPTARYNEGFAHPNVIRLGESGSFAEVRDALAKQRNA